MKKLLSIVSILFLTGCYGSASLIGPASGVASGKVAQSALTTSLSYAVKDKTGKFPVEHAKNYAKEKNKQILFNELSKATSHLGINNKNIHKYDFPVRKFSEHRQEILEELIKLKNNLNPDLVLLPNSNDLHQDHSVIYQEGLRAFKHISILGYELPWNNLKFTSNYHFILNQSNLDAKLKAISEYKSQNFRTYKSKEYWKGLAVVRGNQVGAKFAEAFEAIRLIN